MGKMMRGRNSEELGVWASLEERYIKRMEKGEGSGL